MKHSLAHATSDRVQLDAGELRAHERMTRKGAQKKRTHNSARWTITPPSADEGRAIPARLLLMVTQPKWQIVNRPCPKPFRAVNGLANQRDSIAWENEVRSRTRATLNCAQLSPLLAVVGQAAVR